jgi:excisionase family DNA binding protein
MRNSSPTTTERITQLLLTPKQAAEVLAISERKLWAMKASGEIAYLKIGRSVRYSSDDLKKWIDNKKKGGDAR